MSKNANNKVVVSKAKLDALADIVNSKTETYSQLTLDEIIDEINAINIGADLNSIEIYIGDFFDNSTVQVNKGIINITQRIIVS